MQEHHTPTTIERALLSTVAYFDLFSYPLTNFELWKWLYLPDDVPPPTLVDVRNLLTTSAYLQQRLATKQGFFFLHGRGGLVALRKQRYLLAEQKYRRVHRALRVFRFLPFIRAIAVCNSLAYNNVRPESDLDLLIICRAGRMWTARLFTAGTAKLFGWRPSAAHTRDTICLSFYLSDHALSLESLLAGKDDRYLHYWIDQLVTVYGDQRLVEQLRNVNLWHRRRLPNAFHGSTARRRLVTDTVWSRMGRSVLEALHGGTFGAVLEDGYRRMQERVLPSNLQHLANRDSRVVLNQAMLKFHENDRRAEFAQRFATQLAQVQ